MPRVDAADENKIKQRLQQAQTAWQPLLSAPAPLTFKLVESWPQTGSIPPAAATCRLTAPLTDYKESL
ncbi:hypothetical protein M5585_13055 [Serratia ureilytica]